MKLRNPVPLFAFALVALGCGGAPRPTDSLAAAESSVRAAKELNAQRDPKAELHLRLAEEEAAHARKLIEDGDNEEAARVLARSHSDAELAIALSKEAAAEQARNEMLHTSQNQTSMNESSAASH